MNGPIQLGLDLTPQRAVAVGDRVRVARVDHPGARAGELGTVVGVRPGRYGPDVFCRPVSVVMDLQPERRFSLGFEHEDLDVVERQGALP